VTNFTAKVDGVAWAPDISPTAINAAAGLYSITGFKSTGSNPYTIILSLANIPGTGTYPLGVTPQIFGGSAQISNLTAGWGTPNTGADGQIVITTLSATQMVGTFNFVAAPLFGSSATVTVTEGQFDIPVSGTFGMAAANQGSSITGTLNGAFAASAATAILSGGNLTVAATGGAPTQTFTMSLGGYTGAATYTLSGSTPIRTIMIGDGVSAFWTSNATGGSGSVVITSANSGRIVGTFAATVVAAGGSATGTRAISGTFSLGGSF